MIGKKYKVLGDRSHTLHCFNVGQVVECVAVEDDKDQMLDCRGQFFINGEDMGKTIDQWIHSSDLELIG
ncbi:hypothetical protein D3C80_950090 [compost metagenome]